MATHEDYKQMLAAYALGALDAANRVLLKQHLGSCAECPAELAELESVVSNIALASTPVEPPSELKSRILEVAASTPQEVRTPEKVRPLRTSERLVMQRNEVERRAERETANVIPEEFPRRSSFALRFYAIAASLLLIASAAGLYLLWNREKTREASLNVANAKLQNVELELAHEQELRNAFSSPTARVMDLNGTETAPKAAAKFSVDRSSGHSMLLVSDLPPTPSDKVYQLWYIADGQPMPGGTFRTNSKGHGELKGDVPPAGRVAAVFAVTLEPAGGSKAPTGAMFLKSPA